MAKIAIIAKIRNGALYTMLQEHGWSQAEFARRVGRPPSLVSLWMQMRDYPRGKAVRDRVEHVTGCLMEDLFPPDIMALADDPLPREIVAIRDAFLPALRAAYMRQQVPSLESGILREERENAVLTAVIHALSPREQAVIAMRFGLGSEYPETYAEIAQHFGVSRERIRQLEQCALRKLRHPRSGLLALVKG